METKSVHTATIPPPPTLSEQVAWDIALAWQPQLQGKVRLVVDRDGPADAIVESYAWVRVDKPLPLSLEKDNTSDQFHIDAVSIMRALMVTWAALASCPGYGGSENGAFWKRVTSELQDKPKEQPRRRRGCCFGGNRDLPKSLTDAVGFFDRDGIPFPRFLVETPYTLDDDCSRLFTRDGPHLSPEVRAKMETLLATLAPYQTPGQAPVVDVCLRTHGYFLKEQDRKITALINSTEVCIEGGASVALSHDAPWAPRFRISHIQFRDSVQLSSPDGIRDALNLMRDNSVLIRHINFTPLLDRLTPADRAMWLASFLRLDGHGVRAKLTSFSFPRHYVSDAVFHAIMSALPFATSIHTLEFSTECLDRGGSFEQADLPWLAYAIFHPRAETSSWRHLHLRTVLLSEHSATVMAAMRRGNNLLALLNGTPPDCDAYFSAQLPGGAVVQSQPNPASEVLFISPLAGITVDLCGISSLDRATWGEWVAVMVPAFGLGWVRCHEVADARTHAPATQTLTGLRLHRNYNPASGRTDEPPEVLLHLVPALGTTLTYLNVSSYDNMAASTLETLLHECASLKTLVVSHAGELWGAPRSTMAQLEELELRVHYNRTHVELPTLDHLQTSLRDLRALRVRLSETRVDQLEPSRAALEQFLRHAPTLRYLHWRHAGAEFVRGNERTVPYSTSLQWTPQALRRLHFTHDQYLFAQEPLHANCAAAFLSVVAAHDRLPRGSALGRLADRGVLTTIFQFATSPVKRFVHIEPNDMRDPSPPAAGGFFRGGGCRSPAASTAEDLLNA